MLYNSVFTVVRLKSYSGVLKRKGSNYRSPAGAFTHHRLPLTTSSAFHTTRRKPWTYLTFYFFQKGSHAIIPELNISSRRPSRDLCCYDEDFKCYMKQMRFRLSATKQDWFRFQGMASTVIPNFSLTQSCRQMLNGLAQGYHGGCLVFVLKIDFG